MVSIRAAVPDDAEAIAAAHIRSWQAAYRGIVPQSYLDSLDLSDRADLWHKILIGEITAPGIDRPVDLVAEVDGHVVAFANAGFFRDAPGDPTQGEIWALYAHPDAWGGGAGFELMKASVEVMRSLGCTTAHLWVLTENDRGRSFYERQGWSATNDIKSEQIGDATINEIRYQLEVLG